MQVNERKICNLSEVELHLSTHPEPEMLHALTNRKPYSNVSVGLRAVAVLESVKGIVVLLVGFGVRALVHRNIEDSAEEITHFLHLNPEGKRSSLFLHLADRTTSKDLWLLAIGALVHSAIHFTEAYGLWHQREWAEWFALLSGASYLPGELYSLLHYASRLKWSMLVANAVVVLFMLIMRLKSVRHSTRMPMSGFRH